MPWHGARFDIRTGQGVGESPYPDILVFPVRVVGETVQIEI